MIHPAEEARTHIMAALEACQADPSLAASLEKLTENLARAQGKLFPASRLEATSPAAVDMMRRGMEHLAQALQVLQDVKSDGPAVATAAASIARSLKALHAAVFAAKAEAEAQPVSPPPAGGASAGPVDAQGSTLAINVNTVLNMNTEHTFYTGFSDNISEGGIFVATFDLKPVGSKVLVNFKLPNGHPVTARGTVHWVREYVPGDASAAPGMGVRFAELLAEDRRQIDAFMSQRAPLFYDDGK